MTTAAAAYRRWGDLQAGLPEDDDGWEHLTDEEQHLLDAYGTDDQHYDCWVLISPRGMYKASLSIPVPPGFAVRDPRTTFSEDWQRLTMLFDRMSEPIGPLVFHDPDACDVAKRRLGSTTEVT